MWWEAQLKDPDQCTRSNLTSVAEEKVTDPGQNASMKGSLKMWSIFPVFPAVKQKCQVFTWLSWGLSYIDLFQFIIVFIDTNIVQLIAEHLKCN